MSTINTTIKDTLVINNDIIDVEASIARYRGIVESVIAKKAVDEAAVATAVNDAFDMNKGARLNMSYIVSSVTRKLDVPLPAYKEVTKRIKDYVEANKAEKGMTLTAAGQPALFATVVGANGGIYRLSDVPAVAPAVEQIAEVA